LADVFVSIQDPRQAAKVRHNLVELLVVAVNAVLVGADTFVEIELKPYWGKPVRNFREGDGNNGIIRSPLSAIALLD
jgi:hypothetical protein